MLQHKLVFPIRTVKMLDIREWMNYRTWAVIFFTYNAKFR